MNTLRDDVTTAPVASPPETATEAFLPFALPSVGPDDVAEVAEALLSGWLTTGPRTKEFERQFAAHIGASHALAVSSATAGLHLALAALGIGPGDEVITTPLTFCATTNVIVHLGATPILADIGADYNLDPAAVRARITPRTRAIIPVHFAGLPCNLDALRAIAREHDLAIVEDAAHAAGASWRHTPIGIVPPGTRDCAVFSFYATKNLTTGEGGMVTCADPDLADKIRSLSLHGISRDAWKRYTSEGSWYYEVTAPGYKYNMTDVQAALGLQQLRHFPELQEARRRLVARYDAGLAGLAAVQPPPHLPADGTTGEGTVHAWHLYAIHLDLTQLTIDRAQFIEALRARGIGASVHFIPIHLHPYYRDRFGFVRGDYPCAEAAYDGLVSLPLYPRMADADIDRVVAAVRAIVGEANPTATATATTTAL